MMKFFKQRRMNGFTVVELLVVIIVIGILAAISFVTYNGVQQNSRDKTILSDIESVETEIIRYSTNNNGALGSAVAWFSGGAANPNIQFVPTSGNVIDVVADTTKYCIRGFNLSSNKNSIINAFFEESSTGACTALTPSVAAGGSSTSSGPLVWLKLNANTIDSSGNGYDGSLAGSPTITDGQSGFANGAYAFNGNAEYVATSPSPTLGTINITISSWAFNPIISNRGTFVKIGTTDSPCTGYGIGMGGTTYDNSGTKLIMLYECIRWIPTTADISVGWHHIVMTIDGSGIPSAYLDGSLVGSYPGTVPIAPQGPVSIGGANINLAGFSSGRAFTGSIDDVRIYDRVLSGAEVSALFLAGAE